MLHPVRVGVGFVDFIQRHHDRNARGAGVGQRFAGLRHDAVVGRHDQNDDVGSLRAAGAHGGEGGVAGGVEKGDQPVLVHHLVGADLLGDAAGFAGGDIGGSDGVQERGFAVVHVAQNGDHRRARFEQRGVFFFEGLSPGGGGFGRFGLGFFDFLFRFRVESHLMDDDRRGVVVDLLIDVGHDAVGH